MLNRNRQAHLSSFTMNNSDMVRILLQPAVDIGAESADDVERWRVMVIEWKVFNASVKFWLVIRAFGTPAIHSHTLRIHIAARRHVSYICHFMANFDKRLHWLSGTLAPSLMRNHKNSAPSTWSAFHVDGADSWDFWTTMCQNCHYTWPTVVYPSHNYLYMHC